MNPNQLALQNKTELESKGYVVDAQGNVTLPSHGGGFFPPWVWAQSLDAAPPSWKVPASDPNSAWSAMYQSGGPFTNHSSWDSSKGTYEGGTDWGTLLGTAGVGTLFAAPALMSLFGAGGAAPAAASGAGPLASGETGMAATAAATAPPASIAADLGGATTPLLGGASSNLVKAIATLGSAFGGRAIANATSGNAVPPQLSQLLDMAVQRQQQQQPLSQAATQGMYAMLPNYARVGTSMPNVPTDAGGALQKLVGG